MKPFRIFILEDERWYGLMLRHTLQLNPDHEVTLFDKASDLLKNLHLRPDALTIDFQLPDMNGNEVLAKVKSVLPELPVIIISEQQDISIAVNLLRSGAYDYLVKDEETPDRLLHVLQKIKELALLREEVATLRTQLKKKFIRPGSLVGESKPMKSVYADIEKAAKSTITVSISGETGTGKEVVAKAIHYHSARSDRPFVALNVAAIPKELIESELFGHEKGAFTGALNRRIGKFEEAHGGTLFLDEIAELDITLQAKLLRVIQERELFRIGGSKPITLDVRIIVATHRNLLELVESGAFRQDLYYRLLGYSIFLPPLRERGNDRIILAKTFVEEFCRQQGLATKELSPGAVEKIFRFPFPGNVRELKSVIELAVVMADDDPVIEAQHIQLTSVRRKDFIPQEEMTLRDYEIQIIQQLLQEHHYDVIKVADRLRIGKSTIYRMARAGQITLREN